MLKFSIDCMMQYSANNLYHGSEVTGSCTTTMPLPTCDFFLFPKEKYAVEKE
jgi:hypothetical protein